MTVDEMKRWIDNASYESLLSHWRFAPTSDPFFSGEVGEHYQTVMSRKRNEVGAAGHVTASKKIGW